MEESEMIIRKPEVRKRVGMSDSTIWRLERQGKFPLRLNLGSGSVGWLASEVSNWIKKRAEERTTTLEES